VLRGRIVVAFYPAYVAPGLRIYAPLYYKAIVVYLYRCRPCQLYVAVVHRFCLEVDHLYRQRGTMVAAMQPEFTELRYLQLNVVIARTSAEYAAELVRCLGQRTIRTARYAEVGAIYFVNTAAQVVGVAIIFGCQLTYWCRVYFVTNKSVSPVLSEKSSFCVHGKPGALPLLPRVAAFNSSASACVKYRRTPTGSPLVGRVGGGYHEVTLHGFEVGKGLAIGACSIRSRFYGIFVNRHVYQTQVVIDCPSIDVVVDGQDGIVAVVSKGHPSVQVYIVAVDTD
jgi:hypothetical protein